MYQSLYKESSWSRIIQHIESGHSFAVISAYVLGLSDDENSKRHEALRNDIRKLRYGYIEQNSGYSYKNKKSGSEEMSDEESFFIPNMSKVDALTLAREYDQESLLFKDDSGFFVLFSNGVVDTEFKTKRDKKGQITFNPEFIKAAYSQLKKASSHQRGQKFSYVVRECVWVDEFRIPDRSEAYRGIKEKKLPEARYIRIL